MKQTSFIIFALLLILITSCEQTKEAKAERAIKKYFKETLDDYDSYSPVAFSEMKIAKSKWEMTEEMCPELEKLIEITEEIRAGYFSDIKITSDADYYLKRVEILLEEDPRMPLDKETIKRIESWKPLLLEFKHYQDTIYASKKNFQPEFIGWKMTHKFRAKNRMGGTELNELEFQFDKDITKVVKTRKIK